MKTIRALKHFSYEDRLWELCFFSLQKAVGRQNYNKLLVLKGAYRKSGEGLIIRECSDKTRVNVFKLKEIYIRYKKEIIFLWEQWGTIITSCPEKLWMPHICKCSKPSWMELWETWSLRTQALLGVHYLNFRVGLCRQTYFVLPFLAWAEK